MLIELQGQIEKITYTSEENGFTVARVKVPGHRDLVSVVGNLLAPMPGEIITMRGEWANHPKFGEQFKIVYYKSMVPATVHGIEKYLGSGLIKGIGPVMAKRIVKKFGKETLDVIEAEIDKLTEVDGIGPKRIEMIKKAWADQKEIREVMLFLQGHGVSSGAGNLNTLLQEALNPSNQMVVRGGRSLRVNDKVMQIKNNYDKEVFNGDIGRICKIDLEAREVTILFDSRQVDYDFTDLDEVVLAYAVSVHKSQGSEYLAVVIPILTQHYVLLQRNLIYTGITRGRKLVVMVGTKKALAIAVKNNKTQMRYTRLKSRLN